MGVMSRVAARRGMGLMSLALGAAALAACSGGAGASPGPNPLADLSESQLQALGQGLGNVSSIEGGKGISVSGTGVVSVDPDLAVLSIGVEETADSVDEARDAAAENMEAVQSALRDASVSDSDMETQRFQIQPMYNWMRDVRELDGYRVTNVLTVEIRDLDNVGSVIDAAVGAAGDSIRVNNLRFTLENGEEAEHDARRLAVQNAKAKAGVYADELGLELGRLLSLNETTYSMFPRTEAAMPAGDFAMDDGAPTTPIEPGEFDVTVNVETVFGIR